MSFGFLGICLIGIFIIAALLVVIGVIAANNKDNHKDNDLR